MAIIKVDHKELGNTADKVDDYVSLLKKEMFSMQIDTITLDSFWKGPDATKFKSTFKMLSEDGSVHTSYVNALVNYSKFLRYAADKYQKAQTAAVNRANRI